MIVNEFIPKLRETYGLRPEFWFQQDGARPHTASLAIECLQGYFGDQLISQNADFPWPPSSPDLSPLDLYLWGTLDARVKARKPYNLRSLKRYITE